MHFDAMSRSVVVVATLMNCFIAITRKVQYIKRISKFELVLLKKKPYPSPTNHQRPLGGKCVSFRWVTELSMLRSIMVNLCHRAVPSRSTLRR